MIPIQGKFLPVFRLRSPFIDDLKLAALAAEFGLTGQQQEKLPGGGIRIADGSRFIEAMPDHRFWFADDDYLWNPNALPGSLLTPPQAETAAWNLIDRLGMRPQSSGGATVISAVAANERTKTSLATLADSGKASRQKCLELDAYVGIGISVMVIDPRTDRAVPAEAQGKGTKVSVAFGEGGLPICLSSSWRGIDQIEMNAQAVVPVAPRLVTSSGFVDPSVIVDDASRLIYRSIELRENLWCLCPYWLFTVTASHEGKRFATVDVTTPAAMFEQPVAGNNLSYSSRTAISVPPKSTAHNIGISWRTSGNSHGDEVVAAVQAEAAAITWDVRFAWRNEDAWESDWSSNASMWFDNVDLAFYSGHAYWNGWQLADNTNHAQDKFLTSDTAGNPATAIWHARLKWIIIAACGPLQDACMGMAYDNAFRWSGGFDGLRLLLGFATDTAGFTLEAARALELSGRDVPLARAWLRAAREEQPFLSSKPESSGAQPRWAAVLAGESDSESAIDDVLPHGTEPQLRPMRATRLRAIWTPA